MAVQFILNLGIRSKYKHYPFTADIEKCNKYHRNIYTDRSIINVLFCETNTFCKCMKPYKDKTKAMEKVGTCMGCRDEKKVGQNTKYFVSHTTNLKNKNNFDQ